MESKKKEFTNVELVDQNGFVKGLEELLKVSTGQIAYDAVRTLRECEKHVKNYMDTQKLILDNYVEVDEKTRQPKIGEGNMYAFKNDEARASYIKEMTELNSAKVEITMYPVNYKSVILTNASGETMFKLRDFIVDETATAEAKPEPVTAN